MPAQLNREIWLFLTILALAAGIGLLADQPFLGTAIGALVYTILMLRNLFRLYRWLLNRGQAVPEADGIWGEIFNELHVMQRETGAHRQQLRDMLTYFQNAAAALPDGMIILSKQNEITWANPAAQALLGITLPRDTGQKVTNLIRDPKFNTYLVKNDFSSPIKILSRVKTGHTLLLQIIPYGIHDKLIICQDITHIIKLELIRSQFIANVSHELRSPITVLAGYLETLQDIEPKQTDAFKRGLATMYEQTKRMERLVTDLLALSKLETEPSGLEGQPVDINILLHSVHEAAEILSRSKAQNISLDLQQGLNLKGDPEELSSLFTNLVTNAVRYTPAKGKIWICWQRTPNGAEFTVSDNGPGIAPEHIPRLTERFYRVDVDRSRETGGTGLGLAIVKHVLERHDGKLEIESKPGEGSTFRCIFPAKRILVTDQCA